MQANANVVTVFSRNRTFFFILFHCPVSFHIDITKKQIRIPTEKVNIVDFSVSISKFFRVHSRDTDGFLYFQFLEGIGNRNKGSLGSFIVFLPIPPADALMHQLTFILQSINSNNSTRKKTNLNNSINICTLIYSQPHNSEELWPINCRFCSTIQAMNNFQLGFIRFLK